jgi:hypothetical protein
MSASQLFMRRWRGRDRDGVDTGLEHVGERAEDGDAG